MAYFKEAPELKKLAEKVKGSCWDVMHIELNDVLFLWEREGHGKGALGCCYKLTGHPIQFFTYARFAIVFYECRCEKLSDKQKAFLMWHELKHIPARGDKLIDHDVQDFLMTLGLGGLEWSESGADVPDILKLGKNDRTNTNKL